MDRLELVVDERQAHQRRVAVVRVQILLEEVQRRVHLGHRRRDVLGVVQRAARPADPVLAAAVLARRGLIPAHPSHQPLVQLAQQPEAHGQFCHPFQAVFQRMDVVQHLAHIGLGRARPALSRRELARLVRVQVGQVGLRALDPRGKHRLTAQKRPDQQVRVGHRPAQPCQLAQRPVGAGQDAGQRRYPAPGAAAAGSARTPNSSRRPGRPESRGRRDWRGNGRGSWHVNLLQSSHRYFVVGTFFGAYLCSPLLDPLGKRLAKMYHWLREVRQT